MPFFFTSPPLDLQSLSAQSKSYEDKAPLNLTMTKYEAQAVAYAMDEADEIIEK